jgi:NifU-like protein involved in Fe-S cluster formation
MAIEYTKKVIEHFQNPKNVGEIKNPDGKSLEGNPACGDMVGITLKVDDKTTRIKEIKFKSYGCASNIATASVVTELAKGKTIDDAKKISWKEVADELGGLPTIKVHCSVLAVDTLKSAIRDYEQKKGILKEDIDELTKENLRIRLKSVVNPASGADIISSNMVKSYDIDSNSGKIIVNLKLCKDHEYAGNIKEEIDEHVSTMKGFKTLEVNYNCE